MNNMTSSLTTMNYYNSLNLGNNKNKLSQPTKATNTVPVPNKFDIAMKRFKEIQNRLDNTDLTVNMAANAIAALLSVYADLSKNYPEHNQEIQPLRSQIFNELTGAMKKTSPEEINHYIDAYIAATNNPETLHQMVNNQWIPWFYSQIGANFEDYQDLLMNHVMKNLQHDFNPHADNRLNPMLKQDMINMLQILSSMAKFSSPYIFAVTEDLAPIFVQLLPGKTYCAEVVDVIINKILDSDINNPQNQDKLATTFIEWLQNKLQAQPTPTPPVPPVPHRAFTSAAALFMKFQNEFIKTQQNPQHKPYDLVPTLIQILLQYSDMPINAYPEHKSDIAQLKQLIANDIKSMMPQQDNTSIETINNQIDSFVVAYTKNDISAYTSNQFIPWILSKANAKLEDYLPYVSNSLVDAIGVLKDNRDPLQEKQSIVLFFNAYALIHDKCKNQAQIDYIKSFIEKILNTKLFDNKVATTEVAAMVNSILDKVTNNNNPESLSTLADTFITWMKNPSAPIDAMQQFENDAQKLIKDVVHGSFLSLKDDIKKLFDDARNIIKQNPNVETFIMNLLHHLVDTIHA